jgi:hypothetical protein
LVPFGPVVNLLLWNCWAKWSQTWQEASM